jgi:NAD-dependent dihydropyrimidine dehydrogenase PreA subunit
MGEDIMAIENIDMDQCIGCGTCMSTCPMDVIRMDDKTEQPVIKYPEDCQICHLCDLYCPVGNIITISPTKYVRPMVGFG